MILALIYMGLMGDSEISVRDSPLILASVAAPSLEAIVVEMLIGTNCWLHKLKLATLFENVN